MSEKRKTAAVVLAAGQGKRMGTRTAKQYLLLDGKPVLYYALKSFEESCIDEVVLVTGQGEVEFCQKEIVEKFNFKKVVAITTGGKERYHSVARGVEKLKQRQQQYSEYNDANREETSGGERVLQKESQAYDIVMIHDGARPFVTPEMIAKLVEETRRHQACVTGTPVKDTIKIADDEGYCAQTPPRKMVWSVQTPQSFDFSLLLAAYENLLLREEELLAKGIQITDDAMVVEHMADKKVRLVEGDYTNIKLTTPEDLLIAEAFLNASKPGGEERARAYEKSCEKNL